MSKSFQEKLNKILRESKHNPDNQNVLNEDQNDSPTRVHPEGGQEVTKGDITGNTVKVDATGPIPTGLDKTLKTNPGPTTAGPTGHIPTNSDLPNGGNPSYGLGEEADDKDEDKQVEEAKDVPPFLKKKEGEDDKDEKKDKKLDEEGHDLPAAKSDEDGNSGNSRLHAGEKPGDKQVKEEADHEEGDKSETSVSEEKSDKEDDEDDKKAVEEATKQLFAGEQLSEAFKTKTATIFEETLSARIKDYRKKLETRLTRQLNERVEQIREELSGKVNGHLDLVVENWVKTHEVALESAIKNQLVEEFIGGLKALFEEHYIEVPAEKVDVIAEMATKVQELEGKLNEQIDANVQLTNKVRLAERAEIFATATKGLAVTQVEKVKDLVNPLQESCKSNEEYKTLVERYVAQERGTDRAPKGNKTLAEQTLEQNPNTTDTTKQVSAVKDVLARMAKK